MKTYPECIPCFLKRVLYEIQQVTNDEELAHEILRECSKIVASDACSSINSAELSTKVHRKAYEMLGARDPYKLLKERSNEVAQKIYPYAKRFVDSSQNPFRAAVLVSIIGNVFDYGVTDFKNPDMMFSVFDTMCKEGLGVDDTKKIRRRLNTAKEVMFFTDNCGEIIFDKLLLSQLREFDIYITLVPKGTEILSDATERDVYKFGLDKMVDQVVPTENYAVGIDLKKMSPRFRKILTDADLIICKGMANYESFSGSGYAPIAYLMRTKCAPVAEDISAKKDINVAKLVEKP